MKRFLQSGKRGFTLVELLVSFVVSVIALGGYVELTGKTLFLSRISSQNATALAGLRNMMERISVTPFSVITSIFPDGMPDGSTENRYEMIIGGYDLKDEQITVNYTDPNSDPLEIIVTASWSGPQDRVQAISLSTIRTE